MRNILELTHELIKEEEANLALKICKGSLMDVFRENYEVWDKQLFPLLKMQGKNRYEYLSGLLAKGGHVVSTDQVGLYLSKVRNEKGVKKTYNIRSKKGKDLDSLLGLTSDNSIVRREVKNDQ